MNNSRSSYRRAYPRKKRAAPVVVSPTVPVLKDIRESLLQQQNSAEPLVHDAIIPRIRPRKVFTFVGSYSGTLTTSTSLEVDTQLNFPASNLGNSANFAAVFDQFRVIGVSVKFMPANVAGGGYPPEVPIYSAIDYDDSNATVLSALLQYDTLKIASSTNYWERSLVPRVAVALYSGSAFTGYGNASAMQWVDVNSINTPYYGLKLATAISPGTCTIPYMVSLTIQFRNIR